MRPGGEADDRAGSVIDGKYRVLRLVGEGGMGTVYEAEHLVLGRRVALKFLRAHSARNPRMVERFLREARSAAAVGSEHIVDMIDVGMAENGLPFIVMEFLVGENLAGLLRRKRPLEVDDAIDITTQVCNAVDAVHRRGIIHRDLKAENVFLIEKGVRRNFVKILDFGVCKFSEATTGPDTSVGVALGTPVYMAPEQARGDRDLDARVDVYAIGVMLYHMVTGRVPFDADSPLTILLKHADETPVPPRKAARHVRDAAAGRAIS